MIDEHYCISPVHLVPSRNLSFIRERLSGSVTRQILEVQGLVQLVLFREES